jgi:hypothetical protein
MSIYLARFYLHPDTGRQQEHLLLEDRKWVLGDWIGDKKDWMPAGFDAPNQDPSAKLRAELEASRFFERTFRNRKAAIAAFEDLGTKACAEGYFLTDVVEYTTKDIPAGASPKPGWQQEIDTAYLRILAGDYDSGPQELPEAETEPMWLRLKAERIYRWEKDHAQEALPVALAAREEIERRLAAEAGFYCWSISKAEIEGAIHELLYILFGELGDEANAFAAIRAAYDIAGRRPEWLAWMQCFCYPEYREDAFETAFRYQERWGGYDQIVGHPEYSAFEARRKAEIASGSAYVRWRAMCEPSPEALIVEAEKKIGRPLPAGYRSFLSTRGKSQLMLHLGDSTSVMKFAGAGDLAIWGRVFQSWLGLAGGQDEARSEEWAAKFGVDGSELWSVATPWDNSSCLAISLADNATYGRCYLWHHDDAFELMPIGDSFELALEAIETGFLSGAGPIRSFLA